MTGSQYGEWDLEYVVLDIETVANERAAEYFAQKIYEPAANLKDPEKIKQNILEKRQRDENTAGLHWWTGKVCCIGAVHGNTLKTFSGEDEQTVLQLFFDWVPLDTHLIAKSGDFFDIPFLVGRAIAHDLGVPSFLRPSRPINDIDHIFSFSPACEQRSSLENYAWGMGVTGKRNKGSEVQGMYLEGMWADIEAYCSQDVAIAAEMLRRWQKKYEGEQCERSGSAAG